MQVKISARHGHLSSETQDKITEKVEKLKRLFDRVTAIEVTADLEHRESPASSCGFRSNARTISWLRTLRQA